MTSSSGFNDDFLDMLRVLVISEAEFIVGGAHAMAVHGVPRSTGDMDVLVRPTAEKAGRVLEALHLFGAPIEEHGVANKTSRSPATSIRLACHPAASIS